jgi:hypothetical protein
MKLLRPSRPWCARNGLSAPRFEPFIDFLVKRGQHVKQGRNALGILLTEGIGRQRFVLAI